MNLPNLKLDTKRDATKAAFQRVTSRVTSEVNDVALRLESRLVDHALPLNDAIDSERKKLRTRGGQELSYYVDRHAEGRPLLLVHSVNAAASAYEMRPLFLHYRGKRPVYAVDLPGFGFSERDKRPYTPSLFVHALEDLIARIKSQHHDQSPDVVALSLSSEFAATAALEKPKSVHSLTFISPTGLSSRAKSSPKRATPDALVRALEATPLGQLLFDALVSRASIGYFLGQSFRGKVDSGLKDYAYTTSHRPGARFAPLAFLSGALFTPDVAEKVYARVDVPALVLYDDDPHARFDRLADFLAKSPSWKSERVPGTRGLPQFDKLDATTDALDRFWSSFAHGRANGHAHAHHAHH